MGVAVGALSHAGCTEPWDLSERHSTRYIQSHIHDPDAEQPEAQPMAQTHVPPHSCQHDELLLGNGEVEVELIIGLRVPRWSHETPQILEVVHILHLDAVQRLLSSSLPFTFTALSASPYSPR